MKSLKHWYARYPGDYAQKTKHLSMIEHGAYALLLDHYYSTEKPLPACAMQLHRICMAFADAEKDAVHTILEQFFILTDEGYVNDRVEAELEKRNNISEQRQKAAEKRWKKECKKDANAYAEGGAKGYAKSMPSTSTSTLKKKEKIIKKEKDKKPEDVSEQIWNDFTKLRRAKKAPVTQTSLDRIRKEAGKINWTLEQAMQEMCAQGWQGFKSEWVNRKETNGTLTKAQRADAASQRALERYLEGTADPASAETELRHLPDLRERPGSH